MKIAQVVPVHVPVPPVGYGGIERVVAGLTDGLLSLGHDVTVFASGDSEIRAKLEPLCERSVMFSQERREPEGCHLLAMERIVRRASDFDIWHFHFNYLHLPFMRRHPELCGVTTLHIRLDQDDVRGAIEEYSEQPYISISNSQRSPVSDVNWLGTVPNGIDCNLYRPIYDKDDYLVFLGRFSQEKGLPSAVEIARRTGRKLKVAGRYDATQPEYSCDVIKPLLAEPHVEFVGEVDDRQKQELLGRAYAVLFPIEWPEPFGLVMIEALACGTPVIAAPLGAVPEVIRDGETGFLASDIESAVAALDRVPQIDLRACRQDFLDRFSSQAMAREYVELYEKLLYNRAPQERVLVRA